MLPLCYAGVAFSLAEVESRSERSPQQNWASQASEGEQNTSLNTLQKIEYLQREMMELRGKVEEQGYQLQQVQEQNKKLYTDLDKRLREGGATAKAAGAVSGVSEGQSLDLNAASRFVSEEPDPGVKTNAINAQPSVVVNDEKAYQAAYRLVQNRDFDGAARAFSAMLEQAPQGKYAPNAHYWLGEINLTKGDLEKAAQDFNIVYRQYPQHPKAADCLLKLGYVEYKKGQWKRSKELLNLVKSQYPGTTSAQLADSRLQRMQQEGHI